ncbi:hypothetical protein, partial [Salmonella enterica]|uniref:hypothetical protein n=1 Tax=Salmonella enterica TaxID=28901 RepID=UPI0034D5E077
MKELFLKKYFPPTKTNLVMKEISSIQQEVDESLSNYWMRFNELVESCPNHKYSEAQLLQYFYHGMCNNDRNHMDSSSNGAFQNNTVAKAR